MNKTLLFAVMALGCVWLVLDLFYGNKYIKTFVSGMFNAMTD